MIDAGARAVKSLYLEANRQQRVLRSRIGCILAMVLMPLGIVLDKYVYPEVAPELVEPRMWCVAALVPILALLFSPLGTRLVKFLGVAWVLVPAATIAWLVFRTDGVDSPYYTGINLLMLAVALLMPWTALEVLVTCGAALLFYVLACVGHMGGTAAGGAETAMAGSGKILLVSNVYFLGLTVAICGVATWFLARLRFREFALRHELADRNVKLDDSYRKLADLERLKSQFFSNVSHELRTPLTLIISPLDALIQRGGTGVQATDAMLTIARDNGLRLLRLINQMLDLVKFDEKAARIHPRNEDLGHLVAGIVTSAAHLARAKGVQLEVAARPEPPVVASVDAAAFEKVLLNLFTNAVKFTPAGGRIDISLASEAGSAVMRVKDTGIGIAPESLARVFDRFAQLDQSSTRKYSGIGIGLALARQLVEAHGGTLTPESAAGQGTTMTVRIPLATGQTAPALPASATDEIAQIHIKAGRAIALPAEAGPQAIVGQGSNLVLVVEDEPDMCQFVVDLLKDDYRVARAGDGLKGLALATELKPALVVLDVMLPGIDGLEVCRRVRDAKGLESSKIVLLTARSDEEAKLTALQNGAHDFLTKPFSSLELRTRVANLLRAARLEEELRHTNDELTQTLKSLRETEAQLIQSEKINALGTLAAGLLHEILNPLNFTLAAVQMALMETPDTQAELRETLTDIESGMKRIRDIVGDLRTFAHPQVHLHAKPFNFGQALAAARRIAGPELADCRFVETVAAATTVAGSEGQIVQLLVNLFTNAARATRGRKDREVRVAASASNGTLTIRVRDNGVGIASDKLDKVFDPFYTTQEPGQGMGLGLTICQTIVRNHGGKIQIESVQGDWTEVILDLPSTVNTGETYAHSAGLS